MCLLNATRYLSVQEIRDTVAAHRHLTREQYVGAQRALNASLTGPSQRKKIVATDADRLGADREGLQDMSPPLNPTIHEHVDPITHGIDDLDELVE